MGEYFVLTLSVIALFLLNKSMYLEVTTTMESTEKKYTQEEWRMEGRKRFGLDFKNWKFKCPKCGNVASGAEFKEAGAEPNIIYSECIGRYVKGKGCDWAAYGLFDICTVHVDGVPVFDFAPSDCDHSAEKSSGEK